MCYTHTHGIINPRRACAARVTVVGSVCLSVCLSVCPLSHISPMERLFVLKTRETKVKKFVGFSLKPLRCQDPALPPLYGHAYSRPFFSCTRMRISRVYTRMIHRRGFSTLVLFIIQCSSAVLLCDYYQAMGITVLCYYCPSLLPSLSLPPNSLPPQVHDVYHKYFKKLLKAKL